MITKIPHGLLQINATFGRLTDPRFEERNIVLFDLPYQLRFGQIPIKHAQGHRLAIDNFQQAFRNVMAAGLADQFTEFAGIYARRNIRGQGKPSLHSWGIAIDMCSSEYPLGSLERMPDAIVNAFRAA